MGDIKLKIQFDVTPAALSLKTLSGMTYSTLSQIQSQMAAAFKGVDVSIPVPNTKPIDDAINKLSIDLDEYTKQENAAAAAAKKTGDEHQRTTSVFSTFGGKLVAVNQGLEVLKRLYDMVSKPVQIAGQFEQYGLQLKILLGSEQAAKDMFKDLADFANRTPFELPEVVKAQKLLLTFGGSALATRENIEMIGDMASSVGAPFEDIAMWVGRAYTAIKAGQPFGEAAQRLMELGLMSGEARRRIEQLQESGAKSEDVWKAFTGSMSKYNDMMKEQSQSLTGLTSTLSDSFNSLLSDIGNAFLPAIKGAVAGITSLFDSMKNLSGGTKVLIAGIVAIGAVMLTLNSTISPTLYAVGVLITLVASLWVGISKGEYLSVAIAAAFTGLTAAIVVMGVTSVSVSGIITGTLIPALAKLGIVLNATTLGWGMIIAGMSALVAMGVTALVQSGDEAEKKARQVADYTIKLATATIEEINKMPPGEARVQFKFQIEKWDRIVSELIEKRMALQKAGAGKDEIGLVTAELDASFEAFKKTIDAEANYAKQYSQTYAKGAIEVEKARVDAMKEGYDKRKAQADIEYKTELEDLRKKRAANEISEEQLTQLKSLAAIKRKNALRKIDEERENEELDYTIKNQVAMIEFKKESDLAVIAMQEKVALAQAVSEKGRLVTTQKYAIERIAVEERALRSITALQKAALETKAAGASPDEAKRIRQQIADLDADLKKKLQQNTLKVQAIDVDFKINFKVADEKQLEEMRNKTLAMLDETFRDNVRNEELRMLLAGKTQDEINAMRVRKEQEFLNNKLSLFQNEYTELMTFTENMSEDEKNKRVKAAEALRDRIIQIEGEIVDAKIRLMNLVLSEAARLKMKEESELESIKNASKQLFNNIGGYITQEAHQRANARKKEIDENLDAKLSVLEKNRDEALSHARTQADKTAINAKYEADRKALDDAALKQKQDIDEEAFKSDKAFAMANAIIDVAEGIAKAWSFGPLLGVIFGAIVAAAGAVQIATIENTKPSGYAGGGIVEGPGTETSDSIPARLSVGEFIVRSMPTKEFKPILNIINSTLPSITKVIRMQDILENISIPRINFAGGTRIPSFDFPYIRSYTPRNVSFAGSASGSDRVVIAVERLAKEIVDIKKEVKRKNLQAVVDYKGLTLKVTDQQNAKLKQGYGE